MTDKKSESPKKAAEKSNESEAKKAEAANAPKVAGVSEMLQGPTTADLNPAYNYTDEDDKKSSEK